MTRSIFELGLPLLIALAAGCTTMGVGNGATSSGADPATFGWKSPDGLSGTLSATLSGGKTYSGQFFPLEPLWMARRGHVTGTDWDDQLVANLDAPNGAHMRCKFQLARPFDGMAGGGRGQCQMPDGKTIEVSFPKT
jgi:hypothetical protein